MNYFYYSYLPSNACLLESVIGPYIYLYSKSIIVDHCVVMELLIFIFITCYNIINHLRASSHFVKINYYYYYCCCYYFYFYYNYYPDRIKFCKKQRRE